MDKTLLTNSVSWMSRTFAICAIALSTALVSCEYDDTELSGRMDQLEERVTKLEKDLATQISSLQQMLEGKLTIASCTLNKETGLYTIVLSNNEVITVAQVAKDAPIMGVMSENDTYYWTLNGKPLLTGAGEKVPVATTPGIRVNPTSKEWEVSPDNGKTWLGTGIKATEGASLFSKVKEDTNFVYFTLADGAEIKVGKATDFRLKVLAGKQYFAKGQTISVTLEMRDVKKHTINKPDGWKASIVGETLRITAPAAGNSYAEESGKVAVVAVAPNGEISISEIAVAVGTAPLTITVDANMAVKFERKTAAADGYYYGVRPLETFSPEQVIADILGNDRLPMEQYNKNTTIADMLGSEPEKGVSYVVYAIEQNYGSINSPEEMLFTVVASAHAKIEATNITYENADLAVEVSGASSCWAGVIEAANYEVDRILADLKDGALMSVKPRYNGKMAAYATGLYPPIAGTEYVVYVIPTISGKEPETYTADNVYTQRVTLSPITMDGTATVTVSDLKCTMSKVSATLTPSSDTYKYYAEHRALAQISSESTDEMLIKELITGYSTTITQAPDVCKFEKTSGLTADTKGVLLVVALSKDGKAGKLIRQKADTQPMTFSEHVVTTKDLVAGVGDMSIKIAGNSNIKNYRYMNKKRVDWLNDFVYGANETALENAMAMLSPDDYNYEITIVDAPKNGADLTITYPRPGIDFGSLESGDDYYFFVLGVDNDGYPTHLIKVEYTPGIPNDKFVSSKNALKDRWEANKNNYPQISNLRWGGVSLDQIAAPKPDEPDYANAPWTADISVSANCAEYWIFVGEGEYITAVGDQNKTSKVLRWAASGQGTHGLAAQTGVELNGWGMRSDKMYIVWKDTEGYYYVLQEYDWKSQTSFGPKP